MADIILEMNNVSKSFPGVKALDDVTMKVGRGKVHALVGENGAGKSTLIKILAGIYSMDEGEMIFDGEPAVIRTPAEAQVKGISVVHQELKLSETLSVAENIFLGRLMYTRMKLVDWKGMRKSAKKLVEEVGISLDVDQPVEELSIARRQIVEICRAINYQCKLLIMDEPSATLTEKEQGLLFDIIERLKAGGMTIIYISHRLEEIFNLADDVTVLRDGKHIGTHPVKDLNREAIISMMVGRKLEHGYPRGDHEIGDVVLKVENLNRKGVLSDINLEVRQGEIFGIAGLVGSGRTELARAILGIDKIDSGSISINGSPVDIRSFQDAIANKMGLVPEERQRQGLIQILSVKENVSLASIDKIIKNGIVRRNLENSYTKEYIGKLSIKTASYDTEVQYLSGGNQQKVVIAKWLMKDSDIIFMDEPTRGIDVGAKNEIYKLIISLVQSGKTVIIISSELPEVIGVSDRIAVMHEGKIVGLLDHEEATQEKIMSLCV